MFVVKKVPSTHSTIICKTVVFTPKATMHNVPSPASEELKH